MIKCPTCSSEVDARAEVCTECGMDLRDLTPPHTTVVPQFTGMVPPGSAPVPSDTSPPAVGATVVLDAPPPSVAVPQVGPTMAPVPPVPTATLALKRGGVPSGESFVLGGTALIGRFDPDSGPVDVDMAALPEASYVSRHHAEIRRDDAGQWLVRDLGSRNGTFVRSPGQAQFQRISDEHALIDGDEVCLGNARFEFRINP